MNKESAIRVGALLIVVALLLSACNAGDQLGPVGLEPSPELQAAEPQGLPGTVQVGQQPAFLTLVPVTPSLPEFPCSESELVGPALSEPSADELVAGIRTYFGWNELECSVWGWDFQLCTTQDCQDPAFEAYIYNYPNVIPGGALDPGSTYYWRVAAFLTEPPAGPRGPWSETRRLGVAETCSDPGQLAAPFLQSPEDGSTQYAVDSLAGHRPWLVWTPSGACQPTEFLVELFMDPESGPVLISHRTGGPAADWEVDQDLQIGVTYFWRVAAMVGEDIGPFSAPWSFTTIGVPDGQPGAVMGRVWNDVCARPLDWQWSDPLPPGCGYTEGGITGNADMDAGESGIAGVTVSSTSGACPPGTGGVQETVTDANGDYVIYLPPGSFCVWIDFSAGDNATVLAGGWPTFPACYYDAMDACTVEMTDGEIVEAFNFGFEMPTPETGALGSISGTVWRDTNANGLHNASEPGLANVEVRLTCVGCPGAGTPTFTSTDSQGNYTFGSLASATYSVEVAKEFPANSGILTSGGWTRPPVSGTWAAIQIVLAGGEDRGGVDFGWSLLTALRPPFRLLPTLQFFLPIKTIQFYRVSTPTPRTLYIMPSATPRTIYIQPTLPPPIIRPTQPPMIVLPTATATRVFVPAPKPTLYIMPTAMPPTLQPLQP
jgi:hypothetical protein